MTPAERAEFIADIAAAIRIRSTDTNLTADQVRWVELAIQKEAQSIEFRRAIIEKSLSALLGSSLLAFGVWVASHVWRP